MLVERSEIAIIGKVGLCTKENNVVAQLWKAANSHFKEVAPLAKKNENGSFVGFWGAMSDETMNYLPWREGYSRGLYLAGVEVNDDAIAPEGWTKWVLPARKYWKEEVNGDIYKSVFNKTIQETIPSMGLKLVGAACEYTDPTTGKNYLFFPVE